MSIGGIGSSPSLWQQDQNYWQQARANDNMSAATSSVIGAMSSAEASLGKGLASIANQTALNRVNTQLSAAIQNVLKSGGTSDTSPSPASTPTASSSPSSSGPTAAAATGTAPVTLSTSLSTLGVLAGGIITVSAGSNTTTYASTGSDTVGGLMNALNNDLVGNAAVTASLNSRGDLVIKSRNTTDTITIGGIYASNIGFGVGHQTFKPTPGSSTSSSASSGAGNSAASPATSSGTSAATSATTARKSYTTVASETLGSATSLLADSGDGGTLVNMLA
ncbi:MAG: hypothetical protein WBF58_22995 [Xanthobacteraceae bacterium]